MTPAGLPDTIAELRGLLLRGELGVAQALNLQRRAFENDAWHCVVSMLDAGDEPPVSLPLAGVGLAHKDIFVLPGRRPECGARHPWPGAPAAGESAAGPVAAKPSAAQPPATEPSIDEPSMAKSSVASAPAAMASVIARLAAAGNRPLAALAMSEHACAATGENPHHPLPVNPLDARAAVGGSSSGSAVAVAAGLCYGSLGTDTAGSVRIPAATCGLVGLKPTRGVLPGDGVAPLAPSLDTVGVIARTADDASAVLRATLDAARCAALDAGSAPDRQAWRIATCWTHADPAVAADLPTLDALEDHAGECSAHGARRDVQLPALPEWMRLAQTILHAEAANSHADALRGKAPPLSPLTRAVALLGAAVPRGWYAAAVARREAHAHAFVAEVLAGSDVLLTPALPRGVPDWPQVLTTSPDFEPRRLLDLFCWLSFVNYLGLPAIVFPIGRDARGRPLCVQAVGRPGSEALLLAMARHAEHSRFDGQGFCRLAASSCLRD